MNLLVTYAMPEEAPRCHLPSTCRQIVTGIGKVLAVSRVARAVCEQRPDLILSLGFCGGLNGTRQGDMVVPDRTRQWDLTLNDLDIPLGHGYAMHCPMSLPEVRFKTVPNPVRGLVITGDRFVDSSVHVDKHAVAVDMETAALAVLAAELDIPLVCLREVSDVADGPQGMPHQQFMDYIRDKGPGYSDAVAELIERGPLDLPPPRKEGA